MKLLEDLNRLVPDRRCRMLRDKKRPGLTATI